MERGVNEEIRWSNKHSREVEKGSRRSKCILRCHTQASPRLTTWPSIAEVFALIFTARLSQSSFSLTVATRSQIEVPNGCLDYVPRCAQRFQELQRGEQRRLQGGGAARNQASILQGVVLRHEDHPSAAGKSGQSRTNCGFRRKSSKSSAASTCPSLMALMAQLAVVRHATWREHLDTRLRVPAEPAPHESVTWFKCKSWRTACSTDPHSRCG